MQYYSRLLFNVVILSVGVWGSACQTSLLKSDKNALDDKGNYSQDLVGKIEIGTEFSDADAYNYPALIDFDLNKSGKKYIEKNDLKIFKFNFGDCETIGYRPFSSLTANVVMHILTFTLVPFHIEKK